MELNDIQEQWCGINQAISQELSIANEYLSKKSSDQYLKSHNKIIELIKIKSGLWNKAIRAGYVLENDVWKFECAPEYNTIEITTYNSDSREYTQVQTNNIPISVEDPILTIPAPQMKVDSQIIIGDIVNIRYISGNFGKTKVIDLIASEIIDSVNYPVVVISRNIETGEDYRNYIVDFVYCPDNNEYYEMKWSEKWERRFEDDNGEWIE